MAARQFLRTALGSLLLTGSVFASTACAAPHGRLYVRVGPPAPIVEARIVAPGPGYVWEPGYHSWNGSAYVWVAGRWERPPRPRAVWVSARWVHERGGWYFVQGHWR